MHLDKYLIAGLSWKEYAGDAGIRKLKYCCLALRASLDIPLLPVQATLTGEIEIYLYRTTRSERFATPKKRRI